MRIGSLLVVFLCAAASPGLAESGGECPGQTVAVSERVNQTFRSLRSVHRNALPGAVGVTLRDEKTSSLIVANIAPNRFAAELLRGSWEIATDEQKMRWQRVLGTLLRNRVSRALRAPLRYEMSVADVNVVAPCEEARARLTLRERLKERELEIALRLVKHDLAWRVWDVITDGASLVQIWRPRFQTVARERGLPGLEKELAHLAQRLGVPNTLSSTLKAVQ